MNSIEKIPAPSPSVELEDKSPGDFKEIRQSVAERLFKDPSYTAFDAMAEMSSAAEEYINKLSNQYPNLKLWVGGSLGRREMLPNSDIDLFVIYDDEDYEESDIRVDGVDKFEVGHISKRRLRELLNYSLVDANRFIDGRMVGHMPAPDIESMILEANTPDHQLANNISEYFFYRYFDFPNKTTPMGPNLKYSTGSSRDTIFFNMISRMSTGNFPAIRGDSPELPEVMADAEERYGLRAPFKATDLLFTVKNVAISVYDKSGDMRNRYVSPTSLGAIYEFAKDKFQAWGIEDSRQFIETYSAARQELEYTVDTMLTRVLSEHPAANCFEQVLKAAPEDLPGLCIDFINSESDYPHSVAAFSTWYASAGRVDGASMEKIADELMKQPLDRSWGALMAVACCPYTLDSTLSELADWLYEHEKGAYLTKLITRNANASPKTRSKAVRYYNDKEIII